MSAELHVAAMPFPTRQGTQAVVHAMMNARSGADYDAHLLTYGEGEGRPSTPRTAYTWHRAARLPFAPGAFQSGPSPRKLALDLALVPTVAALRRRLRPGVVVAHHVEATMACLAGLGASSRPLVFFAHTALGPELPTYARRALEPLLARAGRRVDVVLCRRADAVAAISPALSAHLEDASGRPAVYVPPPWPVPAPATDEERQRERNALRLEDGDRAVVYAGNLDAYQGWDLVIGAVTRLRQTHPRARLVVATAADPSPLENAARVLGIAEAVRTVDLPRDEAGRRALHAAADVAIIPRRAPGGLPIKLLDALARGVPTVAAKRATAGLPLERVALVAADDDPEALANGLRTALSAPRAATDLGARGREYVRREHSAERFTHAMDALIASIASIASARAERPARGSRDT